MSHRPQSVRMLGVIAVAAVLAACSGSDGAAGDASTTGATTAAESVPDASGEGDSTPESSTVTNGSTSAPATTEAAGFDTAELLARDPLIGLNVIPPTPPGADLPLPPGMADFDAMFTTDGADGWATAREHVDVFKLHAWQVRHHLSDEQLVAVFGFLDEHDIPLMFETEPLPPPDPAECDHTESFEGPYDLEVAQRIHDLGGTISLVAIEEPYHFAHKLEGPGACRYPVERVVDEVIDYVEQMREIFPGVPVGTIEPIWSAPETVPDDMAIWLDTYAERAGEPFAFLHLDPDWYWERWPEVFRGIEEIADARGVPLGVLYNGGVEADSATWMQFMIDQAVVLESEYGVTPQHVLIQSWVSQPELAMPDDDLSALTSGVVRYVGDRARLEAARGDASTVIATVTNSAGEGLVGATVRLEPRVLDEGFGTALIRGTVPDGASIAEILIRTNAEGVGPGPADVRISEISYTEDGAAENLVPNGSFDAGLEFWGPGGDPMGRLEVGGDDVDRWIEIGATPDQQVIVNGGGQQVSPGATFELRVEYSITPESIGSTLVAVEFPGFARNVIVLPAPGLDPLEAVTDADGLAVFDLAGFDPGSYEVDLGWPGDLDHWPARATLVVDTR